jgi:hypothetical protein
MAVLKIMGDSRHQTTFIAPTWKPYDHAMNRIAFDFRAGDWDYWLSIDADNPPQRNPLDLVDFDLDIIGLPTPIFNNSDGGFPICWNAFDKVPEGYNQHPPDPGNLAEVDAVGSGCILIHRRVIEGMKSPWFVRETDEIGRVIHGPDFYFCTEAKRARFHVWTHYGFPCRHFNELELTEAMEAFAK